METGGESAVESPDESASRRRRCRSNTPIKKKRVRGELSSEETHQGPKTFQNSWLEFPEFRGWLQPVPGDQTKAKCVPCSATFCAGKSDAEKHARGIKHSRKVLSIKNTPSISTAFGQVSKEEKVEKEVKKAEIGLAAFFVEHNIAIMAADHLVELVKKLFHDSEIAKRVTLDRTKCTAVMKNILAKSEKEQIVLDLKTVPFSVLVDESTDVANFKNMCLLTKYVSPSTGKI